MTTNNNRDRSSVNVTHGIKTPDDNTELHYDKLTKMTRHITLLGIRYLKSSPYKILLRKFVEK